MSYMKDLLTDNEEDHYADFMSSMAIRKQVQDHIARLPEDMKQTVRDKRDVLYKMGVPWRGIRLAILGDAYGSKN
jgi:hypothetical protein